MADLEAQGVTFTREGDAVAIHGMTRDSWVNDWLERHRRDLLAILGKPERVKRPESVNLDDLVRRAEEMAA